MLVNGYSSIDIDPEYCFGAPRFAGSRIPVRVIAERFSAGWSDEELMENYPKLTSEMLNEARRFIDEGGLETSNEVAHR